MTEAPTPRPELSVVIPSWNTRELLRVCLEKLAEADLPSHEVIVVDNGSEDDSADWIAENRADVVLVRNERNEGFAIACNQGMRRAEGEWVLLLNSDTEVEPDAIEKMIAWLREHPEYGGAAPRLVNPDGSKRTWVNLSTSTRSGTPYWSAMEMAVAKLSMSPLTTLPCLDMTTKISPGLPSSYMPTVR